MKKRTVGLAVAASMLTLCMSGEGRGQMLDQTPTRVQTSLKPGLERIGTLKPKDVRQLSTSMWSLGCETLDRDLASWDAYRDYLVPLGIRRIRLQGGWAPSSERAKGVYDFAWLDRIVDDAQRLGLEVCLETSYGNKLYQKDAALGPGGPLPEGDETLAAWDAWVEAMARRYSAKGVRQWLMYNEPNLVRGNTVDKILALNIRTAEIIKRVDPSAQIGGLASANVDLKLIDAFLAGLAERDKAELFHWLVYHAYSPNPDSVYPGVRKLQEIVRKRAPHLRLWQGEAGCASEEVQYALKGYDWTELSQAKWNARRMLGDLAHGVESAVFTISDLSYEKNFISRYGLLKTQADNSIIKVKTVYYVVQNVVTLFNDAVERLPECRAEIEGDAKLSLYAFRDKQTGRHLLAFWDGTAAPSNDTCTVRTARIKIAEGQFKDPVWIDLVTGQVYAIPAGQVIVDGGTYSFDVPVYDAPCAIADRGTLPLLPARSGKQR